MHPRNQDVGDLFTPPSGFSGMSADAVPYTYYQSPNHPQRNHPGSPYFAAAKQNQQHNNVQRGGSYYQTNLTTSLESTGQLGLNSLYVHAETQSVPNVINNFPDVQNEAYLNLFVNEGYMTDISGGIESSAIYYQDGTRTINGSSSAPIQKLDTPEYATSPVCVNNKPERLDVSPDSAISSLSSGKVPSALESDWGDGSDSGHDYRKNFNGPYDYSSNIRSFISRQASAVQKKYHMFGKRCIQEDTTKNTIVYSKMQISNSKMSIRDCDGIENSAFLNFEVSVESERNSGFVRDTSSDCNNFQFDGHLTRDEKRARNLHVPIPVPDIINLPMDEFNERISKYDLNENQLSLIRDIRRRGKNKVAAQNCRKRKLDTIISLEGEVQEVRRRKDKLLNERTITAAEKRRIANKFAALHHFIFQFLRDAEGNRCSPSNFSLQQQSDGSMYLLPRGDSKQ